MKVIVIGGGAAGMMSAITSATYGNDVVLLEKNEKLGKKIYITGKGRCNLSNDVDIRDFMENVVRNPKFLFGSLNEFSPKKTMDFFENNGLTLKVERGNRVFPSSDKASDVTKTLEKILKSYNVSIRLNTTVKNINCRNGQVSGVVTDKGDFECDKVIVCTGGKSYPLTGSTGDGYFFAKAVGHTIIDVRPGLCGINVKDNFCKEMQGLSLKNVCLTVMSGEKVVFSDFGEMLFTHFGISGPIVLTCSSYINRLNFSDLTFFIDFKPALTENELDARLLREFETHKTGFISSVISTLLPKSAVTSFINKCGISLKRKVADIPKGERETIVKTLKNFSFKCVGLRSLDEAIITSGGVSVKEINPKTMESKKCKGLFFAGEVLDVDALTGGFNMQIAFSTGYAAGKQSE